MRGIAKRGSGRVLGALGTLVGVLFLTSSALAAGTAHQATNDEYALLVLANEARSDPSAFGWDRAPVPPLVWDDGLARAARAHSQDMADNGCFRHDSCNGQPWWKRLQTYFTDWVFLAENIIALDAPPDVLHRGWMTSSGHRANILSKSAVEFGAGLVEGTDNFGKTLYGTEDFGTRALISLRSMPAIPAAAVLPREGDGARRLVANFYDYDGPPQAVRALVGGSCVELALETGAPAHGTYAASRAFQGQGCVPVVFEAVRGDGRRYRFPKDGAILVAAGGATCAERSATAPAQNCGGPDPEPTPAPTPSAQPTPTTGGEAALVELRVVLLPGPANASLGQVTVVATLPDLPGFDPTGLPLDLHVGFRSGDWSRTLPAACDGEPCLQGNERRSSYRASYGKVGPRVSFTRGQDGSWRMRYWSRGETLGRIAPGPVTLQLTIGSLELMGVGEGEVKENKLIAK